MCSFLYIIVCYFVLFVFDIEFFVLLPFSASDYIRLWYLQIFHVLISSKFKGSEVSVHCIVKFIYILFILQYLKLKLKHFRLMPLVRINSVNLKEKLEATKTVIRSCKSKIFIYITAISHKVWFGLWCLTPLSTIF